MVGEGDFEGANDVVGGGVDTSSASSVTIVKLDPMVSEAACNSPPSIATSIAV